MTITYGYLIDHTSLRQRTRGETELAPEYCGPECSVADRLGNARRDCNSAGVASYYDPMYDATHWRHGYKWHVVRGDVADDPWAR